MRFIKSDNVWSFAPDACLDVRDGLPAGNYTFCQHPVTKEYYLEESEAFDLPARLYGKTRRHGERILAAFRDRLPGTQVGVLLSGAKGSGKTLLAKHIASISGLPVIIVNTPFTDDRFMRSIQGIEQPAVILFDEFEKLYVKEAQEAILTLFDGVYTARNKIMIITCNDRHAIQDFFHNRPSRLRYAINFEGLETEFIEEYCAESLDDKKYVDDIIGLAAACDEFNFDMLQTLVQELNRYGDEFDDAIEILNIKPVGSNSRLQWSVKVESPDLPNATWQISSGDSIDASPMQMISSDLYGKCIVVDICSKNAAEDSDDFDEDADSHTLFIRTDHLFQVDPYKGLYTFKINEDGTNFVVTFTEQANSRSEITRRVVRRRGV